MLLSVLSAARTGPKPDVCLALVNSQSRFPLVLSLPPPLTLYVTLVSPCHTERQGLTDDQHLPQVTQAELQDSV